MRNLRIFQNSHVWKILRKDVNFLNISEYFSEKCFLKTVPIRIKIIRKIFTRDVLI